MKIRDLMSTNVATITEDTSIHDAKKIMDAHKIRRLPVMKKDKLLGLVTKHMLLEASPSDQGLGGTREGQEDRHKGFQKLWGYETNNGNPR